jgi:valyl-tRNA synthetase
VLYDTLRLLHPFMPFITEEIYQNLPGHNETIMLDEWPVQGKTWPQAVEDMQQLMSVIRSLRNIRAEFNIAPGTPINTIILVRDKAKMPLFENNKDYLHRLAQVEQIDVVDTLDTKPSQAVSALTSWSEIYVPLEGIIDIEREILRLEKELKAAETDLQKAESKLSNDSFLARAPQEVVAKEEAKAEEARVKREGILQRLGILKQS